MLQVAIFLSKIECPRNLLPSNFAPLVRIRTCTPTEIRVFLIQTVHLV